MVFCCAHSIAALFDPLFAFFCINEFNLDNELMGHNSCHAFCSADRKITNNKLLWHLIKLSNGCNVNGVGKEIG